MVNLRINDQQVHVPEGTTIMDAAAGAGIQIPHLCYLRGINEIGACRVCCVEVEGESSLVAACSTRVRGGMRVITDSPKVRRARTTNLQLIMSQHEGRCSLCDRSGRCQLQELTNHYDFYTDRYAPDLPSGKDVEWEDDFPLIRDSTKCIKCLRCVQICHRVQKVSVWDLVGTGRRARVDVRGNLPISESACTLCGQCITHCPTGALRERKDTLRVLAQIDDPGVVTIAQIAPAVRSAWFEQMGLKPTKANVNKLCGVLKKIGFDYVFDTSFSADLTIMEEASELIARLQRGDLDSWPMFTSCCPGWVRFLKASYPDMVGQLSTSKSPMQMFGAVIKSYFAEKIGVPPQKICSVAFMPCVAKKAEAAYPTMVGSDGVPDVDYALTTRELQRLIDLSDVSYRDVEEMPFDHLMGDYTGAGVIFGTTGGVMEAALRTADYLITGKNPDPDQYGLFARAGRIRTAWREAEYTIGETTLHIAVASGLRNADELIRAIRRGEVKYDFVEIMACPGGCAGGGGQPVHKDDTERAYDRGQTLRGLDRKMYLRFSHENPDIRRLYDDYLGAPLSERAEKLLHTDQYGWLMPGEEHGNTDPNPAEQA